MPIEDAKLFPGVTLDDLSSSEVDESFDHGRCIRGKALIFWDDARPGKKRDAIDTDQITPTTDCVSESLDELDKRWKEGAFRHLMPDFRRRVHRGQTFLIAGDRFGIGSSREMSPAGLKAIAEEVGLELVIVCGDNMGDIFRRNAINLGLNVVQCPEAVEDAQDEDEFEFHTDTRELRNITQGKVYKPYPLTPREDAIRRNGGIVNIGRREFPESVRRKPEIRWPGQDIARGLTTTQLILWAHRVDKDASVKPGSTIRIYADLLPASDGTAPFAIYTFESIAGKSVIYPRQAAIVSDHFVFTGNKADEKQTAISRQFADRYGLNAPYYAKPGEGIFHFYLPQHGLIVPGGFYAGADSHSRAYGAYGAVGIGVGSTALGFGWATGYVYFTVPRQRRVVFTGKLQPWVSGKDIILALLRKWGKAQGMSVELVDREEQLPVAFRHTIANMMAEAEATNGVFAPDSITLRWFESRGFPLPYPEEGGFERLRPGEDAQYDIDEEFDLTQVSLVVARPYSPANVEEVEAITRERITFQKAYIGSCTNGSYEDLWQAAKVIWEAKKQGVDKVASGVDFVVFPGSAEVASLIERPDSRLGGSSVAELIRSTGGAIRKSWCGPCFGQGPDALKPGEVAVTTFNRNWHNRMGVGGLGYLASPVVVAASALAGYICGPGELHIDWDPAGWL